MKNYKDIPSEEFDIFKAKLEVFLNANKVALVPSLNVTLDGIVPVVTAKYISETEPSNVVEAKETGEVYIPPSDSELAIEEIINTNSEKGEETKLSEIVD